ncbi:MAG TPA: hypothetical protein VEA37_01445 [Flavobacterium sp.]|nr:hypothetical protein [Flavobacterium sp.]
MIRYKNLEGHSGVTGYEAGPDRISVQFTDDRVYLYTYKSAGIHTIENMKRLARAGKGLSTYISQKVKDKYEKIITRD